MPCNGTKYYRPPTVSTEEHQLVFEKDMKSQVGKQVFDELMSFLIGRQARIRYSGIPLTGHFIDYRGSMVNWCPIGRNAKPEDRQYFVAYDLKYEARSQEMQSIEKFLDDHNYHDILTVKLGGSTSFDIYPRGWDKTFCLRHFEPRQFWFIGDRCRPSGNDYELYKYLESAGYSFKTTGPNQTKEIILNQIIPGVHKRKNP